MHDAKLNTLVKRISVCMEGEHLLDVAAVCADMTVFALSRYFKNDPETALAELELLLEAMRVAMRRGMR